MNIHTHKKNYIFGCIMFNIYLLATELLHLVSVSEFKVAWILYIN